MKKILYLIILIPIAFGIVSLWYTSRLSSVSENNQAVSFTVTPGEKTLGIADRLEKEKLISSVLAFRVHFYFNKHTPILAGEYVIDPQTTMNEVISKLTGGAVADREAHILIREGLTVKEINEQIKKMGYLADDSFLRAAKSQEGYLFPDTYRLYKDFTAADLIQKMRSNLDHRLTAELRQAINNSGHSVGEIIIMASILEKEARTATDMKIVAGIFWNRIQVGQALQSDATLAYALGVSKVEHSIQDTKFNSPYNTYRYKGLPAGPISNPGMTAILAALYPAKTDYNYFLTRPDTGETVFSRTLEEHNAAKAKYLK